MMSLAEALCGYYFHAHHFVKQEAGDRCNSSDENHIPPMKIPR
jgi:hypothetical protein